MSDNERVSKFLTGLGIAFVIFRDVAMHVSNPECLTISPATIFFWVAYVFLASVLMVRGITGR